MLSSHLFHGILKSIVTRFQIERAQVAQLRQDVTLGGHLVVHDGSLRLLAVQSVRQDERVP